MLTKLDIERLIGYAMDMTNTEIPFIEAIRTESDEYLRRYMKNKRIDTVSVVHKSAVKLELERRAKKAALA